MVTWLPQNALLAHNKTLALLNHCGVNSLYEVPTRRIISVAAARKQCVSHEFTVCSRENCPQILRAWPQQDSMLFHLRTDCDNGHDMLEYPILRHFRQTPLKVIHGARICIHCIKVYTGAHICIYCTWCPYMYILYKGYEVQSPCPCPFRSGYGSLLCIVGRASRGALLQL